jgi:hypothetical protein
LGKPLRVVSGLAGLLIGWIHSRLGICESEVAVCVAEEEGGDATGDFVDDFHFKCECPFLMCDRNFPNRTRESTR